MCQASPAEPTACCSRGSQVAFGKPGPRATVSTARSSGLEEARGTQGPELNGPFLLGNKCRPCLQVCLCICFPRLFLFSDSSHRLRPGAGTSHARQAWSDPRELGRKQGRGLQRGLREAGGAQAGGVRGRQHHQTVARQEGRGRGLGSEAAGLLHPHWP